MIRLSWLLNMPPQRYVLWFLVAAPTVILLAILLSGWSWTPESSSPVSDFLVEYPIPFVDGNPLNIIVESPGHTWFTMPEANAIGSLIVTSTIDFRFIFYQVPTTTNSSPYDLVYDHDRNVIWFTENEGNKIASLEPIGGTFTEYPIPTDESGPTGIALSPDGIVWFVERDANQLARLDPDAGPDGEFVEFAYPLQDGALEDIAVSNPNSIWFTAPGVERVVRYVPNSADFLSVQVNSGPGTDSFAAQNIVLDVGGHPWVTAPTMGRVGLLVPGTLTLWRWYQLPVPNAALSGLTYAWEDRRHQLWYSEGGTGHVGLFVIDITGTLVASRRHPLSTPSSEPVGIAIDSDQQLWIAEYESQMIASWLPPYNHDLFLPVLFN